MKKVIFDCNCDDGKGPILSQQKIDELQVLPNETVLACMDNEEWDATVRYDISQIDGRYRTPWYLELDLSTDRSHPEENSIVQVLCDSRIYSGTTRYSDGDGWFIQAEDEHCCDNDMGTDEVYVIDDICLWYGEIEINTGKDGKNTNRIKLTDSIGKMGISEDKKAAVISPNGEWISQTFYRVNDKASLGLTYCLPYDEKLLTAELPVGTKVLVLQYFGDWNGKVIRNRLKKSKNLISLDTYSLRWVFSDSSGTDGYLFRCFKDHVISNTKSS